MWLLPASQHCLPNPLKHHICSKEISPPTPATAGFLPLPAPQLSVCGWGMFLFISAHSLLPIRTYHLLAVGPWSNLTFFKKKKSFIIVIKRCRAQKDNANSVVRRNAFHLSHEDSDWFRAGVFIFPAKKGANSPLVASRKPSWPTNLTAEAFNWGSNDYILTLI